MPAPVRGASAPAAPAHTPPPKGLTWVTCFAAINATGLSRNRIMGLAVAGQVRTTVRPGQWTLYALEDLKEFRPHSRRVKGHFDNSNGANGITGTITRPPTRQEK